MFATAIAPQDFPSEAPWEPEDRPWFVPAEDMEEEACLPAGLDTWEPGPALAAVLSTIDLQRLTERQRLTVLRARQRLVSHDQAGVWEAMVAVSDSYRTLFPNDPEAVWRCAAAEIGAALRLTRRAAEATLDMAEGLWERLPGAARALQAGEIDPPRARLFFFDTLHLDEETAREVAEQLLPAASRFTTGQLRERIRRLAIVSAPDQASARFDRVVSERRVVLEPTVDGTADLLLIGLSPDIAQAARSHIEHLARRLKSPDEPRTLDQLRADVAGDLLMGRHSGCVGKPSVELRTDLQTLAGLAQYPAELAGYGPVIADIARQVAARADRLEYVVSDPGSGEVAATGTTRRRPSAGQARETRARDARCVFPGCRMPATQSDLDHTLPWAEKHRTEVAELAPLCRHHHRIRHHGWTYRRLSNGDYRWKSPLGRTYLSERDPP